VAIFRVVRVVDDDEIYELKDRTKVLFLKTSLDTGFAYKKCESEILWYFLKSIQNQMKQVMSCSHLNEK